MSTNASSPKLPRALGLRDLVLLGVAAILNLSLVPPGAGHGRLSLLLWILAFLLFFLPEAVAVLAFAKRYPGEGGIYLWTERQFGARHGFISGWCYWTNNLFYVPMQLVYISGAAAFASRASAQSLVNDKLFVGSIAFGWLVLITFLNVRGLGIGKWVQNVGAIGAVATVGLLLVAAAYALVSGTVASQPAAANVGWGTLSTFSVMCFAFIGIELASTMGDEIQSPERNIPRSVLWTGAATLVAYVAATAAVQMLVRSDEIGTIEGIMQAVTSGASRAGVEWLVAPIAILMTLSIGGTASAWFAGSARIPFVAGLERALPPALGRVHPRWQSPHVALLVHGILSAAFLAISFAGSTVAEAYQVLLKAGLVIQLVPFVYLFAALIRLDGVRNAARLAGVVGCAATVLGMLSAFIPTGDVASVWVFELKMVVGSIVPIAVGIWLFSRSSRR